MCLSLPRFIRLFALVWPACTVSVWSELASTSKKLTVVGHGSVCCARRWICWLQCRHPWNSDARLRPIVAVQLISAIWTITSTIAVSIRWQTGASNNASKVARTAGYTIQTVWTVFNVLIQYIRKMVASNWWRADTWASCNNTSILTLLATRIMVILNLKRGRTAVDVCIYFL